MGISAKDVKELRERTGVGMMDCKKALTEAGGDIEKALEELRKSGAAKAVKKAGREIKEGRIGSYIHFNGKAGAMVEIGCETDFVARSDDFKALVDNICMHVVAMGPLSVDESGLDPALLDKEREIYAEQLRNEGKPENMIEQIVEGRIGKFKKEKCLLDQPYVKDDKKTVRDLIQEGIQKMGENITVRRFVNYTFGD